MGIRLTWLDIRWSAGDRLISASSSLSARRGTPSRRWHLPLILKNHHSIISAHAFPHAGPDVLIAASAFEHTSKQKCVFRTSYSPRAISCHMRRLSWLNTFTASSFISGLRVFKCTSIGSSASSIEQRRRIASSFSPILIIASAMLRQKRSKISFSISSSTSSTTIPSSASTVGGNDTLSALHTTATAFFRAALSATGGESRHDKIKHASTALCENSAWSFLGPPAFNTCRRLREISICTALSPCTAEVKTSP
mmetsp:Transcript_28929/g.74251  ORF Transcript_28929/g.74251 Transcript_28929/m.74251 type:complete len:253 (+) Transcript_28929:2218-2976(+)